MDIADKGSVITRDHAVKILAALSVHKQYAADTLPLLLEQVITAPINQLPSYAETALAVINDDHKQQLLSIINTRLPDVDSEAKIKRLEKVLKKLKK